MSPPLPTLRQIQSDYKAVEDAKKVIGTWALVAAFVFILVLTVAGV